MLQGYVMCNRRAYFVGVGGLTERLRFTSSLLPVWGAAQRRATLGGSNGHIAVIHFATSNGSLWPLAGTHERQVRRSPVAIGIHGGRWVSMPRHPRRHGHQARRPMLLRPPDRHRQCAMRRLHAPRSSTFVCAEPGISPVHFSANACNLAQYFAPCRNAGECARSRMATSTIEQGALFCNMLRVLRG